MIKQSFSGLGQEVNMTAVVLSFNPIHFTRYLTPPATSTAVERLFSAAGLIMDAKRNKLSPAFVDKLLFLREAHLLGICKLDWK